MQPRTIRILRSVGAFLLVYAALRLAFESRIPLRSWPFFDIEVFVSIDSASLYAPYIAAGSGAALIAWAWPMPVASPAPQR